MLHEILLSLSGHASPFWDQLNNERESENGDSIAGHISPPERSMLAVLAHLSKLHIKIKELASTISSTHRSIICRAVAGDILSRQLGTFKKKVLEVEHGILSKDAAYLGAYDIVPLSTVVGEFAPWTRRLDWLWEVANFMLPSSGNTKGLQGICTGSKILDFLESETYTGYSDLEEIATALLTTAQTTWMRQMTTWLLYGKLTSQGNEDFFVLEGTQGEAHTYSISYELVPKIVSSTTAESILAIGNSLNHIRNQKQALGSRKPALSSDPALSLLAHHLEYLKVLSYPLSSASLASSVASIHSSTSKIALSQLLPLAKVREIMTIIQEFLLLGRGEFAVSLIAQADRRISSRSAGGDPAKPVRRTGRLDDISVQSAEATEVLNQAWSDLASLQADDDLPDEIFEQAKQMLRLKILRDKPTKLISTIFPSPATLNLTLPSDSSFSLFLSTTETQTYATLTSYLLSIRRAEIHLSDLWKLTPLRRCHPTPVGPPLSATRVGSKQLSVRRTREDARAVRSRKHWASAGKALFVLNELDAYLHGEVVAQHWGELKRWIDGLGEKESGSAGSRPTTSHSAQSVLRASGISEVSSNESIDPAAIADAHRLCLRHMKTALFLENDAFVDTLRELLSLVDHFIGLFSRLQSAWQGLDLQEDEGVVDALMNYKKDEGEIWWEMERSRGLLESNLMEVVERVKEFAGAGAERYMGELSLGRDQRISFVPYRGRTIDRLLMKLEFLAGQSAAGNDDNMGRDD